MIGPPDGLGGSHNYRGAKVCGICALDISNELHNVEKQGLGGPMAQTMLELAKEFRRRHPQYTPHANPTRAYWTKRS